MAETISEDKLRELIGRVEKATGPEWQLDEEIVRALGGQIRRVTRLGLNGRTRGSDMVFWENDPKGRPIPKFTSSPEMRSRAAKRLRAKLAVSK